MTEQSMISVRINTVAQQDEETNSPVTPEPATPDHKSFQEVVDGVKALTGAAPLVAHRQAPARTQTTARRQFLLLFSIQWLQGRIESLCSCSLALSASLPWGPSDSSHDFLSSFPAEGKIRVDEVRKVLIFRAG